jgi:hypothetical protein
MSSHQLSMFNFNDSPLLNADAHSQTGSCFLEEKLKPRKKAGISLVVFKDNSGEYLRLVFSKPTTGN